MKNFKQFLDEKGRCWTGYKPVPGKKPYSKGSCKEEEVELDEMDKSQKSQERHGDYPLGIKNKDANMVKPITSKKVKKDTLKLLNKAFNKEEVELDERSDYASRHPITKGIIGGRDKGAELFGGKKQYDTLANRRKPGHEVAHAKALGHQGGDEKEQQAKLKAALKSKNEEVEELDELNYDTVKSLYQKRKTMRDEPSKKSKEVSAKNVKAANSRLMGFKSTQNQPVKEGVEVIWEAKKDDDDMPDHEVKVFDYDTNYFHICPTATKLYKDIEHKVEPDDYDLVEGMAKLQDCIFFIEKHLKEKKGSPKEDDMGYLLVAQNIKDQLDRMLSMTTPEMRMEHGYLQGHIETIKELLDWENRKEELDEQYEWLEESAAWRRKEGKSPTGGLNAKGIASYRRENPGSKLNKAVTGKVKPGSKAAKRRKSFCARMGGMKGPMKKPNGEPTRKALALRKWKCR